MSSVTFPTAIGGDGSTVTDDDNATTGLRNGGWRTRFIPCFTNLVNIADYIVSYTAQTSTFAEPPPMGSTIPNTGAFTRVTVTGSTAPANGLYLPATNALGFATNSTERVRIDSSGNVGIGTSSPGQKFVTNGASGVAIQIENSSDSNRGGRLSATGSAATGTFLLSSTSSGYALALGIDGTAKLILDSSGNLGLGVTPSGWASSYKVLQIGTGASLSSTGAYTLLGQNFYNDGALKYISTGAASYYQQVSGAHSWYNAPSGTADAAISFTQAMTLDASGNLGIGTTSPATNLHLYGTASQTALRVENTTNTVYTRYHNTSGDFYLGTDSSTGASFTGTAYARFLYSNGAYPLIFFTNAVERARIDSSGNFIQTVNTTAATLSTNGTMTFSLTNNTTLKVSVRGSDGTTRSANITLA